MTKKQERYAKIILALLNIFVIINSINKIRSLYDQLYYVYGKSGVTLVIADELVIIVLLASISVGFFKKKPFLFIISVLSYLVALFLFIKLYPMYSSKGIFQAVVTLFMFAVCLYMSITNYLRTSSLKGNKEK